MDKVKIATYKVDFISTNGVDKSTKFYEDMAEVIQAIRLYDMAVEQKVVYLITPLQKGEEVILDANLKKPGDFYIHSMGQVMDRYITPFVVMNMLGYVMKCTATAKVEHKAKDCHNIILTIQLKNEDGSEGVMTGTRILAENIEHNGKLDLEVVVQAYIENFLATICPGMVEETLREKNKKFIISDENNPEKGSENEETHTCEHGCDCHYGDEKKDSK